MRRRAFFFCLAVWLRLCVGSVESATFTVSNLNDKDAGSLRQAINDNNNAGGGNTIVFDPNLFNAMRVIQLTSGELTITKDVTISGISPQSVQINGNNTSRIFNIASGVTANISNVLLTNAKSASGVGGAVIVSGTLNLTNCEITGNSAPGLEGGGIYALGTGSHLTLTGCTVSNNSAAGSGGVGADGAVAIINSTVANNTAASGGGGGIGTFTSLVLQSCTIAGNHADNNKGGGIYVTGGPVTIQNTIVSNNTASSAKDVFGTVTSKGYNIIGSTDGNTGFGAGGGVGDQLNVAAALGPLQDNGGLTNTMAPTLGSKAIDQGKASYPGGLTLTSDQRGFARTIDQPDVPNANLGDATDVGAVEIGKPQQIANGLVVNTVSGAIGICTESDCTLPSAVSLINSDGQGFTGSGTTITFAPGLSGEVNLTQVLELQHAATIVGPTPNGPFPLINLDGGNAVTILYTYSDLTISYLGFYRGNASKIGSGQLNAGALQVDADHVTLTNCLFESNNGLVGGAIYSDHGTVNLTNCNFYNNRAQYGGAIGNEGSFTASYNTTLSLTNCSFLGNLATAGGGAISSAGSNNGSATIVLRNCSFNSNDAPAGQGGDIDQATNGSGVAVLDVANTIFSPDAGGSIASTMATVTSRGHNIASDAAGGDGGTGPGGFLNGPGDIRNTDPKCGGLLSTGGLALAIVVSPGSPAIDAADPNFAPPTDERGRYREGPPDIGAFEFNGAFYPVNLGNISTRLAVQTGDNVLIGGFIVTGTQPKKVIIRALGPSVPVPGTLADPVLELYSGSTLLESNDNWVDSPNKQAIIDSTIAPSSNLESAIVRTLPANGSAYTAIVRGVNNGTGIGVVEAYDLDRAVDSKLANISTRGFVQTGDNILIAGTIILGQIPQKVIVRALGPSTGVPGAMADPTLELHDANGGLLEFNDNWVDSPNKQAIIDSTIPPKDPKESAIVRTLAPASYTAIVRGANNTTGIAVVEVYALQ